MKVQIIDDEALTSPTPRNVRLYLQVRGWQRRPTEPGGPDVWILPADYGDEYEVIAPSSRAARDYSQRIAEFLRTLSIVENRSEHEVLRDLSVLTFDVQYFRTHHGGPPGTAPLRDAAATLEAALALLAAATTTIDEPRLVLPNRKPTRTTEFMNKVLAGPTAEGSYVVSVWVPVPPRLTPEEDLVLFDDPNEPFERTATRRLNQALSATREAARRALDTDSLDAFQAGAADGISANLCEALAVLAGPNTQPFDVQFAWALDRAITNLPSTVPFESEAVPVLTEAARELRARIPEEEVRLRGNVVRLHREGQLGPGDVPIAGVVVDDEFEKARKVWLNLAEEDYENAITAHQTFADVEVLGELLQRGTRTYMTNARGFTVIPSLS